MGKWITIFSCDQVYETDPVLTFLKSRGIECEITDTSKSIFPISGGVHLKVEKQGFYRAAMLLKEKNWAQQEWIEKYNAQIEDENKTESEENRFEYSIHEINNEQPERVSELTGQSRPLKKKLEYSAAGALILYLIIKFIFYFF